MADYPIYLFQDNATNGYTAPPAGSGPRFHITYFNYYDIASIGIGATSGIGSANYFLNSSGNRSSGNNLLRKSNKDNFSSTENMNFLIDNFSRLIDGTAIDNRTFVPDPFIESGIYYTYKWTDSDTWTYNASTDPGSAFCSLNNETGITYVGIIPNYDGSFLMGINGTSFTQVKITYNENISSFQEIVKDSIIETIGSTYPYIIRQAVTRYKKIAFSGTIVTDMNYSSNNLIPLAPFGTGTTTYNFIHPIKDFYTTETIDANANVLYNQFITNNEINYGQNYVLEKTFRENLLSFLNNGKPKVLKTAAEGMFLVRLTNLSFTPKQQLGRMIYDFSCDLTEIAPANAANIQSYIFSS